MHIREDYLSRHDRTLIATLVWLEQIFKGREDKNVIALLNGEIEDAGIESGNHISRFLNEDGGLDFDAMISVRAEIQRRAQDINRIVTQNGGQPLIDTEEMSTQYTMLQGRLSPQGFLWRLYDSYIDPDQRPENIQTQSEFLSQVMPIPEEEQNRKDITGLMIIQISEAMHAEHSALEIERNDAQDVFAAAAENFPTDIPKWPKWLQPFRKLLRADIPDEYTFAFQDLEQEQYRVYADMLNLYDRNIMLLAIAEDLGVRDLLDLSGLDDNLSPDGPGFDPNSPGMIFELSLKE